MTEYELAVTAALDRIASALERLADEPEKRREHERTQHATVIEAITMRQAVEGVAVEVEQPTPAEDRVAAARDIVREALDPPAAGGTS